MIVRGTHCHVDMFDRAQTLTATPGVGGWAVDDVSSAGSPTYACITEDGGAMKLTIANTSEAENITMHFGDILPYDLAQLKRVSFIAKVADIDALSVLVIGVGTAQADDEDTVTVNAWFKMEGATSTTALVVETDDNTNDNNDVATGTTLGSTYKKLTIDFTNGLADVRFYVDGARVAASTTFDMSDVTSGQNVQPYIQISKPSGTGVPSVTIARYEVEYNYAYGA